MNSSVLFAAFIAIFLTVQADDVIVGTSDNFAEIIGKDELTLVKFFAPWCGHCKKMAPDFIEAAAELKGKAVLVDLDATVEKDLAKKYDVRGFPTLKLFSKGEVVSDYKGGRTKDAIIEYINRAMLPSVTECDDSDAVNKFVKDNAGKSIIFGAALDKLASEYKKVSMSLRDVMPDSLAFGNVADIALIKDLSDGEIAADSILIIRDGGSTAVFSGKPEELEAWAKVNTVPLFAELSRENASVYTELENSIFIIFQDPAKKDEAINAFVSKVAEEHRDTLAFTWINIVELKSFAEHMGVADNSPAIAIYNFKSDVKYIFDGEYSEDTLAKWIKSYIDGELEMTVKSEEVPETNDEPVKIVVGKSWDDIVLDESKDVLVEQYAPWCGHCKKLAPILDELAAELKGVETLVISKMDATKNDAPKEYKAQGYPTLHFFPAGSKTGVVYDGGRTKEDFVKYFKENCTHKEGLEVIEDEKKEDEETKEEL